MIYITGDIHGDIDIHKLTTQNFPQQRTMTKDDYLIICGDFGLLWDDSPSEHYWLRWLSEKPFTTLWIDGNHENFDMLKKIPCRYKFDGVVQEVTPSVFHLMRGYVYTIDNLRFFTMGGATSHDKMYRREHYSWWQEELPSSADIVRAWETLKMANWNVDYVITHCAPTTIVNQISTLHTPEEFTDCLDIISQSITFKHWYFGHYHIDKSFDDIFTAVYNNIRKLQ